MQSKFIPCTWYLINLVTFSYHYTHYKGEQDTVPSPVKSVCSHGNRWLNTSSSYQTQTFSSTLLPVKLHCKPYTTANLDNNYKLYLAWQPWQTVLNMMTEAVNSTWLDHINNSSNDKQNLMTEMMNCTWFDVRKSSTVNSPTYSHFIGV